MNCFHRLNSVTMENIFFFLPFLLPFFSPLSSSPFFLSFFFSSNFWRESDRDCNLHCFTQFNPIFELLLRSDQLDYNGEEIEGKKRGKEEESNKNQREKEKIEREEKVRFAISFTCQPSLPFLSLLIFFPLIFLSSSSSFSHLNSVLQLPHSLVSLGFLIRRWVTGKRFHLKFSSLSVPFPFLSVFSFPSLSVFSYLFPFLSIDFLSVWKLGIIWLNYTQWKYSCMLD